MPITTRCTCGNSIDGRCHSTIEGCEQLFLTKMDNHYNDQIENMEEKKYPIGGFAPGNYTCKCCICKQEFQGDKRAVQCESCAVKALRELLKPYEQPCAVWVKGQYDRLYEQLKADPEKRIVCYVDYDGFSRRDGSAPCRDISTVRGSQMEFTARGIGYGGAESWLDETDKKESFLKDCIRLNVEWLDESGTAAAVKQIDREWICDTLIEFTIAYIKSTNKDIANDAAEYLSDKLKDAGVVYVLSEDESHAAEREDDGKAQFDALQNWLSGGGYSFDGEYYYDDENNFFTPDQIWEKFKQQKEK